MVCCVGCNDRFAPSRAGQKWCSLNCWNFFRNKRVREARRCRLTVTQKAQKCFTCGGPISNARKRGLKAYRLRTVCSDACRVKAFRLREKGVML